MAIPRTTANLLIYYAPVTTLKNPGGTSLESNPSIQAILAAFDLVVIKPHTNLTTTITTVTDATHLVVASTTGMVAADVIRDISQNPPPLTTITAVVDGTHLTVAAFTGGSPLAGDTIQDQTVSAALVALQEIIPAVRRVKPSIQIFGYTSFGAAGTYAAWLAAMNQWVVDLPSPYLLDGICLDQADESNAPLAGISSRANLNAAVLAVRGTYKSVFALVDRPSTLFETSTLDDAQSVVGTGPYTDYVVLNAYGVVPTTVDANLAVNERLGKAQYLGAIQEVLNVKGAATIQAASSTNVSLSAWRVLAQELEDSGIGYVGIDPGFYGQFNNNWFYLPSNANALASIPVPNVYQRLYGYALPNDALSPLTGVTVNWSMSTFPGEIGGVLYPGSGVATIAVDQTTGYWEINLVATSGGLAYSITATANGQAITKSVTMLTGSDTAF